MINVPPKYQIDFRHPRAQTWSELNETFRAGRAPQPLPNGRYRGELLAVNVAPGLTQLIQFITARWMPWQGKCFDAKTARGENIFTRDSYALAHIYWPLYRAYQNDTPLTYRAFSFRTRRAPGLTDPDCQVLKIDYDLRENPSFTIRRVLDEIVQVDENFFLGKAHLKWWWG
ncbi:MAG: hypothetical protein HY257_11610, partial [Chloroflexi bacterium]|nr:hypothetical protein [Chloroflexota bacterium]